MEQLPLLISLTDFPIIFGQHRFFPDIKPPMNKITDVMWCPMTLLDPDALSPQVTCHMSIMLMSSLHHLSAGNTQCFTEYSHNLPGICKHYVTDWLSTHKQCFHYATMHICYVTADRKCLWCPRLLSWEVISVVIRLAACDGWKWFLWITRPLWCSD